MADHKQRCKKCKYHGVAGTIGIICNYLLVTNHMRGCEATHCSRYEKGERIVRCCLYAPGMDGNSMLEVSKVIDGYQNQQAEINNALLEQQAKLKELDDEKVERWWRE